MPEHDTLSDKHLAPPGTSSPFTTSKSLEVPLFRDVDVVEVAAAACAHTHFHLLKSRGTAAATRRSIRPALGRAGQRRASWRCFGLRTSRSRAPGVAMGRLRSGRDDETGRGACFLTLASSQSRGAAGLRAGKRAGRRAPRSSRSSCRPTRWFSARAVRALACPAVLVMVLGGDGSRR